MDEDITIKVLATEDGQVVRLPDALRFDCAEVSATKVGNRVILEPKMVPKYKSWAEYFKHAPPLPDDFEIPKDRPGSERSIEF